MKQRLEYRSESTILGVNWRHIGIPVQQFWKRREPDEKRPTCQRIKVPNVQKFLWDRKSKRDQFKRFNCTPPSFDVKSKEIFEWHIVCIFSKKMFGHNEHEHKMLVIQWSRLEGCTEICAPQGLLAENGIEDGRDTVYQSSHWILKEIKS